MPVVTSAFRRMLGEAAGGAPDAAAGAELGPLLRSRLGCMFVQVLMKKGHDAAIALSAARRAAQSEVCVPAEVQICLCVCAMKEWRNDGMEV